MRPHFWVAFARYRLTEDQAGRVLHGAKFNIGAFNERLDQRLAPVQLDPTNFIEAQVGCWACEQPIGAAAGTECPIRHCRECGCTDLKACQPSGCWWLEADLCSQCGHRLGLVAQEAAR